MQKLKSAIQGSQDEVKSSRFPAKKLSGFSSRLDIVISQLKQPAEKKVVHQHHVPMIILISAGLFIFLSMVCSGWYMTANKLES